MTRKSAKLSAVIRYANYCRRKLQEHRALLESPELIEFYKGKVMYYGHYTTPFYDCMVKTNPDTTVFKEEPNRLTIEQQDELRKIKDECIIFHELMKVRLNDLCNRIDYRNSSKLSLVGDRLELFVNELTDFDPN